MTWDPLLSDEWPTEWVPFTVEVEPKGDVLELLARGHLDPWTAGALLRVLIAVYEPSFTHVHIDLREATGVDGHADEVLARCQEFAAEQRARFRVSSPPAVAAPAPRARPLSADDATAALA